MKKRTCAILAAHTGKCAKGVGKALEHLLRLMVEEGFDEFICGMERGLEQLAAETILTLRETMAIRLCGLVDSEEQWLSWSLGERDVLFSIMQRADYEYRVANAGVENLQREKLRYVSVEADRLLLLCSVLSGRYALLAREMRLRGKEVFLLDPVSLRTTRYLELL